MEHSVAPNVDIPDHLVVYGRDTCDDTTRARAYFVRTAVPFEYVNLDLDDESRRRLHGAGLLATPVIVLPSALFFVEPPDDVLAEIARTISGGLPPATPDGATGR